MDSDSLQAASRRNFSDPQADNALSYRSGVAARLAGVPVETLRVWERRYAVAAPRRSARGQRLYSEEDVRRLALIKRLVDQGHPIGVLARLPAERLAALLHPAAPMAVPQRLAVVGEALARQLAGLTGGPVPVACCSRIEHAPDALRGAAADVLLIDVPELDESVLPAVLAARAAAGDCPVVVLYRFGASAAVSRLREHGCVAARAPGAPEEILLLAAAALPAMSPAAAPRFDERSLQQLVASSRKVGCECPRHLADLLLMLGSFERYSAQCAAQNAADAALHRTLKDAAGGVRALLESALETLARAEGLPLPPELTLTGKLNVC